MAYSMLLVFCAFGVEPRGTFAPPQSDATVLHVDFENYRDGVVQALNAGVRWLGDPFAKLNEGTVEVTSAFAFGGVRSGHVASEADDQIARIRLQPRYDAPMLEEDEVIEFLFRPVREESRTLSDFILWQANDHAGLTLLANGNAESGTYRVDVLHAGASPKGEATRTESIATNLPQARWLHVVMYRTRTDARVALWIGEPGKAIHVGSYPDPAPESRTWGVELGDTSLKKTYGEGYWDDIRIGAARAGDQPIAAPEAPLRDVGREAPAMAYPVAVTSQHQLFADDALVEGTEGLTRTMHPVTKHPANPLIVPDKPWEGHAVLLYGSVIPDPESGRLRMWYLAWGKHLDQPTFICYAESDDGITWTKPNLGLFEFQGSKDNNIVMPGWSQNVVLHDPRDPDPTRRYKAMLRLNGTRGFFSPDGLHWEDAGVILDQAYDATTVQWNPFDEQWIAMVKIFKDGKRARGYAESKDFLHWSDTYFMAVADERDAPGDEMYAVDVFAYESLLFGQLRMYHTESDKVDIQLMTSRNGKHWSREIRAAFIPCAEETGRWDFANNAAAESPPIRMGDKLFLYYSGRSTLHDEVPNTGAIGLGMLRVDGFFSMYAGAEGGILTTKPITLAGDSLCINADVSGGQLSVEVLDEHGDPIPGFGRVQSDVIQHDAIRIPITWQGLNVAGLQGRTVRLRFHMSNTHLYAFWVE